MPHFDNFKSIVKLEVYDVFINLYISRLNELNSHMSKYKSKINQIWIVWDYDIHFYFFYFIKLELQNIRACLIYLIGKSNHASPNQTKDENIADI